MKILILLVFLLSNASYATVDSTDNSRYKFKFTRTTDFLGRLHYRASTIIDGSNMSFPLTVSPSDYPERIFPAKINTNGLFTNRLIRAKLEARVDIYRLADFIRQYRVNFKDDAAATLSMSYRNKAVEDDFNNYELALYYEELKRLNHITIDNTGKFWIDYKYFVNLQLPYFKEFTPQLLGEFSKASTLTKISFLTDFVQAIPYNQLPSGAFRTPVEVLNAVGGDCDEKSLLLAGLIKAAFPGIKPKLLVLPLLMAGHAILIIPWNEPHPHAITINNEHVLAFETTGFFSNGILPADVVKTINSGKYFVMDL